MIGESRRRLARWAVPLGCGVAVLVTAASGTARTKQATNGWSLVLSRPSGAKYEDFAFPDQTHGWLVSATGDILNTMDGGATWAVQATRKGPLRSIDFYDATHGFAGTLGGVLWGTTDGGVTWDDITATLPHATKGFCGMTHIGKQVHIVGRYNGGVADYYYSPDGGKTWKWSDLLGLAQGLVEIQFINEKVGFIGGMANGTPGEGPATILKTTDGGLNWRTVYTHDGGRGFTWKIWPINATTIYASLQSQDGTYRMAQSTDAGETWKVFVAATGKPLGPGVQGLGFLDANTGFLGGFFQGMYMTTDGGKTWEFIMPEDRTVNRFERVGKSLITASSSRGILRYDPPSR